MKDGYRHRISPWILGLLAILAIGCASFPVNPPIEQIDPETGYRLELLELGEGNTDETFVIVSLSGGGMRAAALDYGVLEQLRAVRLPSGGTLLDEIDILSSTSMASMVAAYYGLHGQEIFFDRFEEEVLLAKMQSAYARKVMSPWQWPRLWSPRFGRSELAEQYLDRNLFHSATFADMPRVRPLVLLGATDMSLGAQFSFVQGHFDRLCTSLDDVTVARAVTASLAFTGAFTPVTFPNYPSTECGYSRAPMIDEVLGEGPQAGIRRYERAQAWVSYEDENRKWIHLLDGGVADNIGMRTVKLALVTRMAPWSIADKIDAGVIKKLVIVLIDGRAAVSTARDRKARAPKLTSAVLTSASGPLSNYSTETIEVVREYLNDLTDEGERFRAGRLACAELVAGACAESADEQACRDEALRRCYESFDLDEALRPPEPEVYFIHARLDLIEDVELRTRLLGLPTTLQLPPHDVELLVGAAREILEASPDYRRLVEDLGGQTDQ